MIEMNLWRCFKFRQGEELEAKILGAINCNSPHLRDILIFLNPAQNKEYMYCKSFVCVEWSGVEWSNTQTRESAEVWVSEPSNFHIYSSIIQHPAHQCECVMVEDKTWLDLQRMGKGVGRDGTQFFFLDANSSIILLNNHFLWQLFCLFNFFPSVFF